MSALPVVVDLGEKLSLFSERWTPKIVAEVNDFHVKLAKLEGELVWHAHDEEDELFLVLAGSLTLRFRDGEVRLDPGQMLVVPKGVEHLPVADEETHVLLFERQSIAHTGDVRTERTVDEPDWI